MLLFISVLQTIGIHEVFRIHPEPLTVPQLKELAYLELHMYQFYPKNKRHIRGDICSDSAHI